MVGLDDGDRVALGAGDGLGEGHVGVSGEDGVDVLGEARGRGGRVLMAEHDDDVGLTVGRVTVLELGSTGVGRGDRWAQSEGGQG